MGELWRYFRDILHWGPIQKPGPLQALAHGTARSMDQTREDMLYLRDQWLPARCEESMVPEHGESRGIIRHVGRQVTETPEQYRARVVHAYAWHMLGGKVAGLPEILKFYGFDVTIENMRPFAPTRWAEFMVRLEAPPSYVDQFRQIEDLPELVWLLNEYKPARSFFSGSTTPPTTGGPLCWASGRSWEAAGCRCGPACLSAAWENRTRIPWCPWACGARSTGKRRIAAGPGPGCTTAWGRGASRPCAGASSWAAPGFRRRSPLRRLCVQPAFQPARRGAGA